MLALTLANSARRKKREEHDMPPAPPTAAATHPRDIFGHPAGLTWLFATEMWERFSYFGNAALVVLYMVKYLLEPGRVEAVIGYGAVKARSNSCSGRSTRSRSPRRFSASTPGSLI